jgi:hypothetical protein
MKHNATLRSQILRCIYAAREREPRAGWVPLYDLREQFGEVDFALAVLEELGHVRRQENHYRITPAGVVACEG